MRKRGRYDISLTEIYKLKVDKSRKYLYKLKFYNQRKLWTNLDKRIANFMQIFFRSLKLCTWHRAKKLVCIDNCLLHTCLVCAVVGYLASFWNRTMFPERCRNANFDGKETYNTMIRSAGSWTQLGQVIEMLMGAFSWRHLVVLSDQQPNVSTCSYGYAAIIGHFSQNANYTVISLQVVDLPTNPDISFILDTINRRARGRWWIHFGIGRWFISTYEEKPTTCKWTRLDACYCLTNMHGDSSNIYSITI